MECVLGCKNSTTFGILGYFPFPSDLNKKSAWLEAIGRSEWEPSSFSVLCSMHFVRDSYEFTSSGLVLKFTAVPISVDDSGVYDLSMYQKSDESLSTKQDTQKMVVMSAAVFTIPEKKILTKNGKTVPVTMLPDVDRNYSLANVINKFNLNALSKQRLYMLASEPKFKNKDAESLFCKGFDIVLKKENIKSETSDGDVSSASLNGNYDFEDDSMEETNDSKTENIPYIEMDMMINQPETTDAIHKALNVAVDDDSKKTDYYVLVKPTTAEEEIEESVEAPKKVILKKGGRVRKKSRQKTDITDFAPLNNNMDMRVLSRTEQIHRIKEFMKSERFINDPHKCYNCGVSFIKQFHYNQHMVRHEKSRGKWRCDICNAYYINRKSVVSHQLRYHKLEFKCKICNFVTPTRENARHHLCDPDKRPSIRCDICGLFVRSIKGLYGHKQRKHKSDSCICSICNAKFTDINCLRVHERFCQKKVVQCPLCPRKFRDIPELRMHERTVAHQRDTNVPITKSQVGEFLCPECGLKLTTRKAFLMHVSKKHPSQTPESKDLYCAECDHHFRNKYSYNFHMTQSVKHADPAQFKFCCNKCSKICVSKGSLAQHMQSHSEKGHYQCKECNQVMTKYQTYQAHLRYAHSGGKPRNHPCSYCGSKFECNAKLLIHIRSHTNERPFECEVCGKTFTSNSLLNGHFRGVHLKKTRIRIRKTKIADQNEKTQSEELEQSAGVVQ